MKNISPPLSENPALSNQLIKAVLSLGNFGVGQWGVRERVSTDLFLGRGLNFIGAHGEKGRGESTSPYPETHLATLFATPLDNGLPSIVAPLIFGSSRRLHFRIA